MYLEKCLEASVFNVGWAVDVGTPMVSVGNNLKWGIISQDFIIVK